ncbi:MAG: UDP-glucose 4-epimerase GalE [Bacilli bacterium]|nr:UDP-glucose 4-epimerase GalE [Bacilli bacterium]
MKVLVTGGLGFIGSHTVVELINNKDEVVIIDNLYNSKLVVLDRIKEITGVKPKFYQFDVQDVEKLEEVFKAEKPEAIIHFAGYKAVGESVQKPLEYYENNLTSTFALLHMMKKYNCNNLVFSSSATIYGVPDHTPLKESDPRKEATSPYGESKVMIERILEDVAHVNPQYNIAILRYFNPIGAHKSGLLGEDPNGLPNNLLPYINKVAVGELPYLRVFGNDYDTVDGTGVRDYIHVVDLAVGHVLALNKLKTNSGLVTYNLGTGKGTSVLEIVKAYEEATGVHIPIQIQPRRDGDVASNYANCDKAYKELGFKAKYTVFDACKDGYYFQKCEQNRKK